MGHRKVYNSRSYGVTLLPRAPDRGLTPERRWRRQTMVKVLADVKCGNHRHALCGTPPEAVRDGQLTATLTIRMVPAAVSFCVRLAVWRAGDA